MFLFGNTIENINSKTYFCVMHSIEPHWNWRGFYTAEEIQDLPFIRKFTVSLNFKIKFTIT